MNLEVNTTAHSPLLATFEHAHLLTDLLTTHQAAQSSLSHLSSRVTHDLACTFRHHHHNHHHNRIHPSSSISTSTCTSTTQHTLTTVWSIHNLTKHTLTHLTHLSTHSGFLPLEHLYHPLLRRATVKLEASHVSPEQRQWMSMIPKMYFDYEKYDGVSGGGAGGARARWSEYTRARASVAEVEAAVAALEREKAIVVAVEEMVARFADSLGGLGEFLLTSPHVVRDVEDGSRGRGWSWSWPSRWWGWSWSGEPEDVEEVVGEEEDDAMREYLKWWFFDNVVIYTGTRWRVFEQDWHGLGCGDLSFK